ncbi:hypothetical protein [Streptomyces sp. P9-A4]|uniref:hypothetical protein n=1 Tax=Streptomyces sp. P9-A4 TaxID=3072285 RepID=UPI002FCA4F23
MKSFRLSTAALLLPLALVASACSGASAAGPSSNSDGEGSLVLNVGDQKGGAEALLQPADALAAFTTGKVDAWAVWDPYTSQVLLSGKGRVLTDGRGLVNGLGFQVAAPAALADPARAKAVGDFVERLRRAQGWVFEHPEDWAKVWAKETGLPYEVALAAVKRSNGTRIPVALDDAAVASEQRIADTFASLGLIPRTFRFADYVDRRFNKDLPPSTTPARSYRKAS